jgi:formyltetrahydrofolate synthetase
LIRELNHFSKYQELDMEGKRIFLKMLEYKNWRYECIGKKLTVHRQRQLNEVLKMYGGRKIPFSHFINEMLRNMSMRNVLAYPVVCAYLCGILIEENDMLLKPEGLELGVRDLFCDEEYW